MKVNLFRGARRIATLIAIVWVIGVAAVAFAEKPYVAIPYEIKNFGQPAERSSAFDCGSEDAWEFSETTLTPAGSQYSLSFCFRATTFPDGRRLVAYRSEKNGLWGNERFSAEVSQYTRNYAASFRPSTADFAWADDEYRQRRMTNHLWAGGIAAGGLIAIWIFTFAVGWVARGFLNVPKGRDSALD